MLEFAFLPLPSAMEPNLPLVCILPSAACISQLSHHLTVINIHGGAFMLGSAGMVNQDQIHDCLGRGWIVIVPNHRLCPQINLLEGPMQDCRDLLAWIQNGSLENFIVEQSKERYRVDINHIFAFGTSSGGHLALCLVIIPKAA